MRFHCTMVFVMHQTSKLNMCCAALTFDQLLHHFVPACVPKLDFAAWWFSSVDVIPWRRLQADGSGLEDLWATV